MPDLSPTPLTLAALTELLLADEPVRLAATNSAPPVALKPAGWPYLLATELLPEPPAQLEASLLLAYAAGTGPELSPTLVRRMLLLKAHRLSQQPSGSLPAAARRLLDFFNRDVWPVVYEQGALGAADNHIPLAHLSLPLLGLGDVNYQGYRLAAADVLGLFGWEPLTLQAQESHALLHGGEFTLAYATEALARATHLLAAAATIGALAVAVYTAANLQTEDALAAEPGAVLPPLPAEVPPAFRSYAQVHELARTSVAAASAAVEEAIRAPNELTLLFGAPDLLLGRRLVRQFPALLLAEVAEAVAQVGLLSAQRLTGLIAGGQHLPRYLGSGVGGQFGLLALPQAAVSLVLQNQQLRLAAAAEHPTLMPNLPDLNAAGATSVLRVIENTEQLLGLELLAAAQAYDLQLLAGAEAPLGAAVAAFRERVTFVGPDRVLAPDLHRAAEFVRQYAWPAAGR